MQAIIYGEDVMDEEEDFAHMDDEKAELALENDRLMLQWKK